MDSEQISKLKTYGLYGVVGSVLILGIIGAFVPEAREYVGNAAKLILSTVSNFTPK